jgi:hypothetical protein
MVPSRHQREKSTDRSNSNQTSPSPSPMKSHQRIDSASASEKPILPGSGVNSNASSAQNSPRVISPRGVANLAPNSPRGPKRSPIPMQFRENVDANNAIQAAPVSNCAFVVLKAEAGYVCSLFIHFFVTFYMIVPFCL